MAETRMLFDFSFSWAARPRRRDVEEPFRILVLADLGGGGRVPLGQRRPLAVDINPGADAAGDDLERLLGRPASQPVGRAPAGAVDMTDWMRAIVAPHVVADIGPEQRALTDAPDGGRWSLLVTDLAIGADLAELQLLATLGALAGRAGAPLLATARPALLGCASVGDLVEPGTWQPLDEAAAFWAALRTSPLAPWIGLALPRILARLPYGRDSDPIGAFAFEELTTRTHEDYLWGSPALALALLAGQAFMENGWDLETGRDLGDLPSHVYREGGTPYQQPCAEVAMGEAAGLAVLRAGVMPFLSYRSRNAARLLGFQSIAEPARALAGAWAAG